MELSDLLNLTDEEVSPEAKNVISASLAKQEKLEQTEKRYRLFAEKSPYAIWTMGLNGKINYANSAVEKIGGYTSEELLGLSLQDILTEESFGIAMNLLQKRLTGKHPNSIYKVELEYVGKDGKKGWLLSTSNPIFNEYGKVNEILGVAHNITNHKKLMQDLEDSERKYRELFKNSLDGHVVLNSEGVITDCNPAEHKLLGYSRNEMIGEKITKFLAKGSKHFFEENFSRLKIEGKIEVPKLELQPKEGKPIPVWRRVVAVHNKDGVFEGANIQSRDISEREKIEEGKIKAERNKAVYESLGAVLHELGQDLQTLIGFSQLIGSRNLSEKSLSNAKEIIYKSSINISKKYKGIQKVIDSKGECGVVSNAGGNGIIIDIRGD